VSGVQTRSSPVGSEPRSSCPTVGWGPSTSLSLFLPTLNSEGVVGPFDGRSLSFGSDPRLGTQVPRFRPWTATWESVPTWPAPVSVGSDPTLPVSRDLPGTPPPDRVSLPFPATSWSSVPTPSTAGLTHSTFSTRAAGTEHRSRCLRPWTSVLSAPSPDG